MIDELEQCECGIIFNSPLKATNRAYWEHVARGRHQAAMHIMICAPCFIGGCNKCEGTRRGEWRCGCRHEAKLADICEMVARSIALTWSAWLANGQASESTGRVR